MHYVKYYEFSWCFLSARCSSMHSASRLLLLPDVVVRRSSEQQAALLCNISQMIIEIVRVVFSMPLEGFLIASSDREGVTMPSNTPWSFFLLFLPKPSPLPFRLLRRANQNHDHADQRMRNLIWKGGDEGRARGTLAARFLTCPSGSDSMTSPCSCCHAEHRAFWAQQECKWHQILCPCVRGFARVRTDDWFKGGTGMKCSKQGQEPTWLMWTAAKVGSHRETPIRAPGPGVSPIRVPPRSNEPVLWGASSQAALRAASTAASAACRRSVVPELLPTRLDAHCWAPTCISTFRSELHELLSVPSKQAGTGRQYSAAGLLLPSARIIFV